MNSPNHDAIVETTKLIERRIAHMEDAMRYSMNQMLYGGHQNVPPMTRWEAFRCRWRRRWWRVQDAWLVLTGKADI